METSHIRRRERLKGCDLTDAIQSLPALVLDERFEQVVKPRLKGRAFLVRYEDDFVMGLACEEDASRVLDVLPKRFGKYGLTIHPDKTRLVPFVRPSRDAGRPYSVAEAHPESFDFLGFTHYWSRSKGNWVVKQKTAGSRFHRAIKKIGEWFSTKPARADRRAESDIRTEAPGTLCVLRWRGA
jgi:hypothetical protein